MVGESDVRLAGEKVGEPRGSLQLYRIEGPLQLASAVRAACSSDGWMSVSGRASRSTRPGRARPAASSRSSCSRAGWCGPDVPGHVTVKVGSVVVSRNQPAIGATVRATGRGVSHTCSGLPFLIPVTVRSVSR